MSHSEHERDSKTESVQRVDKYHVQIDGVVVVATLDQETRLRNMTDEQRARFARIMDRSKS